MLDVMRRHARRVEKEMHRCSVVFSALAVALLASAPAHAQPTMTAGHVLQDSGIPVSFGTKCGQHKLAFVGGKWWGVLSTSRGVDFYSLDRATQRWSAATFPAAHVTSDTLSRADVLWTGQQLLVLTDERASGVAKLCLRVYDAASGGFSLRAGPIDVVTGAVGDTFFPLVQTVVVDSLGRAWVSFRASASGYEGFVKGSTGTGPEGWTQWSPRIALADTSAGLGDTISYGCLVAFSGKVGLMWADQRSGSANGFKFRWRSDASSVGDTWSAEEMAQGTGENLADDHINLQSFEGRIYAAVKTNLDTTGRPILELLRRDVDGTWRAFNVVVSDGTWRTIHVSRPILVLEPGRRLVHYFYNGGGVAWKSASMDAPDFSSAATLVVASSEAAWNTQSTSQLVDSTTGLVVGCDVPQSTSTWTYWAEVVVPSSNQGTLASITVTPDPASTVVGGSVTFRATGRDANGGVV
jgi:hypothetical protein